MVPTSSLQLGHSEIAKGPQEPPVRVLFLPLPIIGHVTPMMRLAAWFAERPGYEAHIWLGGSLASLAPEGAVVHGDCGMEDIERLAGFYHKMFSKLSFSRDWADSVFQLQRAPLLKGWVEATETMYWGGVQMAVKVRPDIVVADHVFNQATWLEGFCKKHCSATWIKLACPGRPEHLDVKDNLYKFLGMYRERLLAGHEAGGKALFDIMNRIIKKLGKLWPKLNEGGLAAPSSAPCILPGCQALVAEKPPESRQVFVGPFVSCQPSTGELASTDLMDWLMDGDCQGLPVVYVCFGTLVQVNTDFLARFARGLRSEEWRVLWSLPAEQQACLPLATRKQTPLWRVEPFVPQTAVLGLEGVRCFVSHCGQNSTHEALALGVPMVCVPFFCDQYEWAASVCDYRQAGVQLDKMKASPEQIKGAVAKVLGDESYRQAARACADDILAEAQAATETPAAGPGGGVCAGVPQAASVILEALRYGPKCGGIA